MDTAEEAVPSSSSVDLSAEARVPARVQHLFVMRHGDRMDDDPNWIIAAPRPWDPPLTDSGKLRARKVGRRLRQEGWNITRVVCSPFIRCIETAAEVINALCAIDDLEDDSAQVAIDPMKVKVSIDYGLSEVMNSYAIRAPNIPPAGPTTLDLEELEALLPKGTLDTSVPKIMTELPEWRETLDASYRRYVNTFQAIADMFPKENILCVTHGEAVSVSITHTKHVTVYYVQYCASSRLQRPLYNLETPPAAGPFELGEEAGISFTKRRSS